MFLFWEEGRGKDLVWTSLETLLLTEMLWLIICA